MTAYRAAMLALILSVCALGLGAYNAHQGRDACARAADIASISPHLLAADHEAILRDCIGDK